MNDTLLDTHELTRRNESRAGQWPLAQLHRLHSLLSDTAGHVTWAVQGRSELAPGGSRQGFLHVQCQAAVHVPCARCLEPAPVTLTIDRMLRLVGSEGQAEQEDPQDDDYDVVVGGREFDLEALIEDELIMALPLAPRHEGCQAPVAGLVLND